MVSRGAETRDLLCDNDNFKSQGCFACVPDPWSNKTLYRILCKVTMCQYSYSVDTVHVVFTSFLPAGMVHNNERRHITFVRSASRTSASFAAIEANIGLLASKYSHAANEWVEWPVSSAQTGGLRIRTHCTRKCWPNATKMMGLDRWAQQRISPRLLQTSRLWSNVEACRVRPTDGETGFVWHSSTGESSHLPHKAFTSSAEPGPPLRPARMYSHLETHYI